MGAGQNRGISRKHAPVFPQPPVSRMGTQVSVVGALGLRAGGRIPNRVAFQGQQDIFKEYRSRRCLTGC